ncbi:phosphatidate cytidylyltransferase [Lacisediminimonas profundi]|uniref:phosphatidate cytidylyltransferase n=1 Tax=Lacisediminimonas profundi TaxID=2603856 RepID=UPI00124B1860|nr:CDP-archaeol synthase [Lacisediminimonas profundi]
MLKTRVITAVVLLAILLAVVYSQSFLAFVLVLAAFQAAAAWECMRLFGLRRPLLGAAVWTGVLLLVLVQFRPDQTQILFALCVALWALRFAPALGLGLPPASGIGSRLLALTYSIAILGCFTALDTLYRMSGLYLFSVMALVWAADIGAYFSGRAFGRHKLAPSISPGKTWEGAVGGLLSVLLLGVLAASLPSLADTFPAAVQRQWGWAGAGVVLALITVASVVGDLFESQLKRRAGIKDSSNLLPGHGGVLDRIDALIPVLPLAVLLSARL